ncbi:MAG: Gfo/Idh/MocA family oxidoreductase [Firmicutes bacterium]|nr:Gfo/Idh/MocA family oxidoreductase [Bacillota bacterium]
MKTFAVIGYGQRGLVYARNTGSRARFVAVCDPNRDRLNVARQEHRLPEKALFSSEDDFFARGKLADYLFICTQDRMHHRMTMKALDLGYDILLEKPIATTLQDCIDIERRTLELNRKVVVCHVLRYSAFYLMLKRVLEKNPIGRIISIEQVENVGFWHQAHSFVRGNWGNEERSNPMILSKCCHDLDLLQWLAASACTWVWSVGELNYFKEENAPEGSTERCLDGCALVDTCPYSARKIYLDNFKRILNPRKKYFWPYSVLPGDGIATVPKLEAALKNGPYGRCVFRTDNDVVDHQVTQMKFANGVHATLTMSAFSRDLERKINVRGTGGQIEGRLEDNKIYLKVYDYRRPVRKIRARALFGAHGGGDRGIIDSLFNDDLKTDISGSIMSHVMAFAAEHSRKNNGAVVYLDDFVRENTS